MASQVHLQVPIFRKCLPTNMTQEWLKPLMLPYVDIEPALLGVSFATDTAGERLLLSVVVLVGLQMTFSDKRHPTVRNITLKRSLSSLQKFNFKTKFKRNEQCLRESANGS